MQHSTRTLIKAEIGYWTKCSEEEAKLYFEHFLECAYMWPFVGEDREILDGVDGAFSTLPKPAHFVETPTSVESREVDTLLRGFSHTSLSRNAAAFYSFYFVHPRGISYFLPTLVRFGLRPRLPEDNGDLSPVLLTMLTRFPQAEWKMQLDASQVAVLQTLVNYLLERKRYDMNFARTKVEVERWLNPTFPWNADLFEN